MSPRRRWWIFSWGEPLFPEQPDAFRYYGVSFCGFQLGWWKTGWKELGP